NVKIRKGEALWLISKSADIESVRHVFYMYLEQLERKNHEGIAMHDEVQKIVDKTKRDLLVKMKRKPENLTYEYLALALFVFALVSFYLYLPQMKEDAKYRVD
ncbi:hypothetical protein FBU59_006338, partial [Linderina macrospora]